MCSQLLLKSVSKLVENVEWSISLLRHFKIQKLLKINCCMAGIRAFRVTQHSQIFSLFFRNRIQCIALYQLYNSQFLLNLRRGHYSKFTVALRTDSVLNCNFLKSFVTLYTENTKPLMCTNFSCQYQCVFIVQSHSSLVHKMTQWYSRKHS